jgi:hypothetical protein
VERAFWPATSAFVPTFFISTLFPAPDIETSLRPPEVEESG